MNFVEFAWLIPLIPLAAFLFIGFFGDRTPEGGGYVAVGAAALAFILSALVGYEILSGTVAAPYVQTMEWLTISNGVVLNFGLYLDNLAVLMMMFASFISMLIFIYSIGYMHDQGDRKKRYYAKVSLFLTAMLGLVMASNFLQMFIFWEIVGLCSYLLIGFWGFRHPKGEKASIAAASAAKKAFLVTRMGDVALLAGLFVLLNAFSSLDYVTLFDPVEIALVDQSTLALGSLLIFGGVIGKSAQFPLHDWLPDAMEGPTTVSALIHAATMVKAGVYLTARSFPIFVQSTDVMLFIAIIGGVTAFFAATMALNNMNIKRVLAYSTLSQLGFMILALGAGGYLIAMGVADGTPITGSKAFGYTAGVFHMMNHAFFKALLFLGAGSVIHAVGTEDMRQMGGLRKRMSITSITMLIGTLSIAGIPVFAGFWSKDFVLEAVMVVAEGSGTAAAIFLLLYILALATAFMTAFYMFRLWYMTFGGEEGEASKHCHGESEKVMTYPLIILSVFAALSGFLILFGFNQALTFNWAGPGSDFVIGGAGYGMMDVLEKIFTSPFAYLAIVVAAAGFYAAYRMYNVKDVDPGRFNKDGESAMYQLLQKRYFFPQFYDAIALKLTYPMALAVEQVDRKAVDGTVDGIANSLTGGSQMLRRIQNGFVQTYAAYVLGGLLLLFVAIYMIGYIGGL